MNSPHRAALVVLISAAIGACGDAAITTPSDVLLATDSASYTAIPIGNGQVVVRVVARFRNPTADPITLDRCFPTTPYPIFSVELVTPANQEGAAYNPEWVCVGHDNPIVVAPGATRIDTLTLTGPTSFSSTVGRYLGALEGTFRVSYGSQRSNEFTVALPPEGVVPFVPRDPTAAIQTDSLTVHLRFTAPLYRATTPIYITISNPRADTSFIVNCKGATGLSLERQTGAEWVTAWSAVIPGCLSPAIVIPPGGRYETSIDLLGVGIASNGAPRFAVKDIPGVYRFVWSDIVDSFTLPSNQGTPIAIEFRRSNAFAIVVAP